MEDREEEKIMQQGVQPAVQMATPGKHSGLGTASLILGIIGIVLTCLAFVPWLGLLIWIGLILGILAVILGAISYWGHWKDKWGLTGFILGLVCIIIFVILLIIGLMIVSTYMSGYY